MTNDEINIAIAKACGWTDIGKYDPFRGISPQWKGVTAYDGGKIDPPIWDIPDYCNDLNAMHETEMVLYEKDRNPKKYTQQLKIAICRQAGVKKAQMDFDICITATARQRAEAFLRTLNLLTE